MVPLPLCADGCVSEQVILKSLAASSRWQLLGLLTSSCGPVLEGR